MAYGRCVTGRDLNPRGRLFDPVHYHGGQLRVTITDILASDKGVIT